MRPPERPEMPPTAGQTWGSDAIASLLRAMDIEFIALTPGASFRGLHDSLVNYLDNTRPGALAGGARGERGRHRARLRSGDRTADGGRPAQQRRPDARDDGDLQRLV